VRFEPELLGRIISCPHCSRPLRAALQFLLVECESAPNLTAQCKCGHFIVAEADNAGKRARCKVCKSHLMLPAPAVRPGAGPVVRVPKRVLHERMKRVQTTRERVPEELVRLQSASHSGRISLRPGEHICVNPECGALLSVGANVCAKCGTNRLTGVAYRGGGPDDDPLGDWIAP
jgi:hypothetical protein